MPFLQMPGSTPVIDFDDLYFDQGGFNYNIAKELATILIDHCSIDELKGIHEDKLWDSSVGSGGDGNNYPCPSQASQRACLANHLVGYANRRYSSCYLSLYELDCLTILLNYLQEDYNPPAHRQKICDKQIQLLRQVCGEFEKEYAKRNPEYLFTLIRK